MKRQLILFLSIIYFSQFNVNASEQQVKLKDVKRVGQSQTPSLPIDVHLNNKSLKVDFNKTVSRVNTTVVSEYGEVVYQDQISTDALIDLNLCEGGEYTIYFNDQDGNVLEGDFYLRD